MRRREAGFTLIEILVVLVILGLVAGLVLGRGPQRSATLDLRSQAGQLAQTLRGARGRAIATNRVVRVRIDVAQRRFAADGEAIRSLPPPMQIATTAAVFAFAPDGSASGGRITLGEGSARIQVAVDWLTGRVSIDAG